MSRRSTRPAIRGLGVSILAAVGCWVVLAPAELSGVQDGEPSSSEARARARARFDSLLPVMLRAGERANAVQLAKLEASRRLALAGTDTIEVGPIKVVVREGAGDRARPYFQRAWEYYAPMLGGNAPDDLRNQTFAFQSGFVRGNAQVPPGAIPIWPRPWTRTERVEVMVRDAVGRVVTGALPRRQRNWVSPHHITPSPDLQRAYRDLVRGASATAESCRNGDLDSCWVAMGTTGATVPSEDLRHWYTEEQRMAFVQTVPRYRRHPAAPDCLAGNMGQCDALLVHYGDEWAPLGPAARAALANVAIEMGGEGAFHRFMQPAEDAPEELDAREVIARTAGMDANAVMAEWLRRVIAAKPDGPATERPVRVSTALWILLFAALSTRSSRWRQG